MSMRMSRPESRGSTAKGGPNFNGFRSPRVGNDSRLASSRSNFSGNGENSEEELATKAIQIQTKRFYIDVKQNKKGKFIKIAEVSQVGRKKRLVLSMSTAAVFRDQLSNFTDHYSTLGPKSEHVPTEENGTLKSEVINRDERRYYYLDLKENSRGRYLRVCMTMPLSKQRFHIAIPAQGMIEIRDALTELLKEFGTEESENELPGAKTMRVENKLFYFDVGQNKKGKFMRISEVRNNYRTAITLPERCWSRFYEIFGGFGPKTIKEDDSKRSIRSRVEVHPEKLDKIKVKVESDISTSDSTSSNACTSSVNSAAVVDAVETAREAVAVVDS